MNESRPLDRNAELMLTLIAGLVQQAWVLMGKVKNPVTDRVERQLDGARLTIDMLAALEERTRGARSDEESRALTRALADLRLNWVDELKREAPAAAEAPAEPPGGPGA